MYPVSFCVRWLIFLIGLFCTSLAGAQDVSGAGEGSPQVASTSAATPTSAEVAAPVAATTEPVSEEPKPGRGILATPVPTADTTLEPGRPEVRVALVIGNGRYQSMQQLDNAQNDGSAVAHALHQLRFEVIFVPNGTRGEMQEGIAQFRALLRKADVAVFYYAGHGFEADVKGEFRHFLMPIDAKLVQTEDLLAEGVQLEEVTGAMKEGSTTFNLIVLDTCRVNPFGPDFKPSGVGLKPETGLPNTLLAFSTSSGEQAADGGAMNGNNSAYTASFVRHMYTKGLKVSEVFQRVAEDMQRQFKKQVSWVHDSTTRSFYFVPSWETKPPLPSEPPPLPPPRVRQLRTWAWVLTGVGAGALAAGAIFGPLALSANAQAESACTVNGTFSPCSAGRSDRERAETFANISTASLVLGGVLVVTGASMTIVFRPARYEEKRHAQLHFTPALSGQFAGALVTGSFQ